MKQVRYGQVLIGQDFRLEGSPVVLRRMQGRTAKPVAHIGGHQSVYGGSSITLNVDVVVEPVETEAAPVERPRG